MPSEGSVTRWIAALKAGDTNSAQALWERYFLDLVQRASAWLRNAPRAVADEEDVALSVLDKFCRGAREGRFPHLQDREDLWWLLLLMTRQKAIDLIRRENARGASRKWVVTVEELEQLVTPEPTPEAGAQLAEGCQRLLQLLPEEQLRSIAVWKMEGFTNDEIARKLGCAVRTVERKMVLIRSIWVHEGQP